MLKVGTRSVVLIDESGKELGRGSGYKLQQLSELDDGSRLTVGGKEVEIVGISDLQTWNSTLKNLNSNNETTTRSTPSPEKFQKPSQVPTPSSTSSEQPSKFKPFKVPSRVNGNLSNFVAERKVEPGVAMFDINRPDALVYPRPPACHSLHTERLVDVVLDPFISKHLRQHQRDGVLFLYANLLGFKNVQMDSENFVINGAILADEMGLGKTLQTVSLIWTFLKQSPIAGNVLARKILIVTPSSLLKNWENEFRKWLGSERITIHIGDSSDKVAQFRSYNTAPILMLSYEMLVRTTSELLGITWDLIVCDEAHRLKNNTIKTTSCLAQIPCNKKLLLTGTPVQNDLGEFFNLVDLACPGVLGSRAKFNREIESVVERSRQPDATIEDIEVGEIAMQQLTKITNLVILRRTSDIINQYLPPKTEYIVFCRPTPYQQRLYCHTVDTLMESIGSTHSGQHLSAISNLKKICNAPCLLETLPSSAGGGPDTWEEQSGKLATVTCLLLELTQSTQEKIVLVSLSTSTLDVLESLCNKYCVTCCRLDGSTPPNTRQGIVNNFNTSNLETGPRVMLLSSKAGGTGLNLIGASRLVLYDIDWNPATDLQAMARVWRDGQKRHCHVYRLITTGTIEEKILQRQMTKRGLDSHQVVPSQFSFDELRDLFSYNGDTECETHDRMKCTCGGSGVTRDHADTGTPEQRQCQLGGGVVVDQSKDDQLLTWSHFTSPIEEMTQDPVLSVASQFVSYVMLKSFTCENS